MTLIMRDDTIVVSVDDIPGYWERCLGGKVRFDLNQHVVVIEPLSLRRIRRDDDLGVLEALWDRVGDTIVVRLAHWNLDRTPTGHGISYEGRLVSVRPSEPDANSCDAAFDEIVVDPSVIRRIAPDREFVEA